MSDNPIRTVMRFPTIARHQLQIVGTLDPTTGSEQWLSECSPCGWVGRACSTSAAAQTDIRAHLLNPRTVRKWVGKR